MTKTTSALEELARDPASRSDFLKKMGGGVAGASAFGLLLAACGGSGKKAAATTATTEAAGAMGDDSGSGDLAILNYALTLEYVEADFYAKAAASGLFKGAQLELVKVIGSHEAAHVAALKATVSKLGGTPAKKPTTKFPLKSAGSVLQLAATVENLGAAAYLGQAPRIRNKEVLAAALSIHSVEARHASALNVLTGKPSTPQGAFATGLSMAQVLPKVKPFIVA
jgi:hypothetical protein